MKWVCGALLALLIGGCGAWGAPAWKSRMAGLWLEERPEMAVYYWFKPDGTGERLRRFKGPEAEQDQLPTPFSWSVERGALAIAIEGEPPRDLGALLTSAEAGVLRFEGTDARWYGCGSGRLPAEFEGLCRQ